MTALAAAPLPLSPQTAAGPLTTRRLNLMRVGYAFMAVGLTLVEWPRLLGARSLPLYEGVVVSMLTALSLLAWLGLRHPRKLLPVLLFECGWKALWLLTVAAPTAVSGSVDSPTSKLVFSCSLVVVILAVVPWRHVWDTYVVSRGEPWRT